MRWYLLSYVSAETDDFVKDHLPHFLDIFNDFKVEVESGWARRLVRCIVPNMEVWVLEGVLDGNTRRRVECEHTVKEIKGIRVGVLEETLEGDLWHKRKVAHIILSARRANAGKSFLIGSSKVMQNLVQLIDVVTAFEERTSSKKLCQDTSH